MRREMMNVEQGMSNYEVLGNDSDIRIMRTAKSISRSSRSYL